MNVTRQKMFEVIVRRPRSDVDREVLPGNGTRFAEVLMVNIVDLCLYRTTDMTLIRTAIQFLFR